MQPAHERVHLHHHLHAHRQARAPQRAHTAAHAGRRRRGRHGHQRRRRPQRQAVIGHRARREWRRCGDARQQRIELARVAVLLGAAAAAATAATTTAVGRTRRAHTHDVHEWRRRRSAWWRGQAQQDDNAPLQPRRHQPRQQAVHRRRLRSRRVPQLVRDLRSGHEHHRAVREDGAQTRPSRHHLARQRRVST